MASSTEFREARIEDKDGILGIGEMYGRMDYLHYKIDNMLTDPKTVCFVAEQEGRIVGFEAVVILPEEKSSMKSALRVHPEFRSQGIGVDLANFSIKRTVQKFPEALQKLYIVTLDAPYYHKKVKNEPERFHLLQNRVIHAFLIMPETLKAYTPQTSPAIYQPSKLVLNEYLMGEFRDSLECDDFVVGWRPYSLKQNPTDYLAKNFIILISHNKATITFTRISHVTAGRRVDVDIYGNQDESIVDHFNYIISILCGEETSEMTEFIVYIPEGVELNTDWLTMDWSPGVYSQYKQQWLLHQVV